MIHSGTYVSPRELDRNGTRRRTHRTSRHRGLQRSAREISLEVRRQRRHGEAA